VSISIDTSQIQPFYAKVAGMVPGLQSRAAQIDKKALQLLLQYVREGAPVRTGALRAAIHVEGNSVVSGVVYNARREYGFVGLDSLGRQYSDPPQPHFRPAAARIGPEYAQMYKDLIRDLWRR
jgi:hypothetical protein